MRRLQRAACAAALSTGMACAGVTHPQSTPPILPQDDALTGIAKRVHAKVMTLDTHVDIDPQNFQVGERNYAQRLDTQVDLTKMEDGKLDAVFFSIFAGQGPLDSAGFTRAYATDTAKFNAVHRLAEQIAPSRIEIAYTAADARRIYASGKKIAFMGVENGYGIGTDITRVKEFYDRGARYMSLAHNGHSQLSDSNTGEIDDQWMWTGLSPLGKRVIVEMNRLGMMIDVSHPSKGSMMQTLALTKAPVIASHSGVRSLCNVSRNLDDEELRALGENGGVVQLVAFRGYVKCDPKADAARAAAIASLNQEFGIAPVTRPVGTGRAAAAPRGPVAGMPGLSCASTGRATGVAPVNPQIAALPTDRRQAYDERLRQISASYPRATGATVRDYVDHIDYVTKMIGLDHVGISSDFDGGGGVDGFNCALEAVNVTRELVRRGYTEEQTQKIWSGNLLRVLEQVEQTARKIQSGKTTT